MIPIAKPSIGKEEIAAVAKVLESGMIAQGPKVREFEEKFAAFCGSRYGVAVNSGTAALHCALHSLGIRENDHVITTPFTFIASANVILMQRAKPLFVDIDEDTFNINPENLEGPSMKKAKALLAVDLYGQMCDYEAIQDKLHKQCVLIEDAAQAVNASYKGKKAGSIGSASTFSFYATKNITCGEGGMLTTNSQECAETAKLYRQHGRSKMSQYDYADLGYNYRTTDIMAAILLEQLKKLDGITKKRIENAHYLSSHLKKIKGIKVPVVKKECVHVYHQYTIRITNECKKSRDEIMKMLAAQGISANVYYPHPLHYWKHYQNFGFKKGDFPIAEKACTEVLSLPVHPHLTEENLMHIINTLEQAE